MSTSTPTAVHVPIAPLDLSRPQRLHVIGVGGPGMSAIALVLAGMGHRVSGSDIRERSVLDRLRVAGVDVTVGHSREVVDGCDAVTYSSAIPETNIEVDEARGRGIPVLRRAGMLASICAQARAVAVAGTHGKTTTTSMLMLILAEAGVRPSFVVGGDVNDVGTGAQWTDGEWLVVEADESDGTHLELPLHGTILTNVDGDPLDHYDGPAAVERSFETYLAQIPGPKVLCVDDPVCRRLAADGADGIVTYGLAADADFRAVDAVADHGAYRFRVMRGVADLGAVELPLRGLHNVVNATGAIAMAIEIGIDVDVCTRALARFGGVARRFDIRGFDRGATLVDDYAHLPAEIAAVLRATRTSGDDWRRVVAVFQPNRFNRMATLWPEYRDAFVDADVVVLTEIFPSGTTPIPGVTGRFVVNAIVDAHPDARVVWIPRREDLVDFVAKELRDGDVCVSMGCGDISTFPDEVLACRSELARRSA